MRGGVEMTSAYSPGGIKGPFDAALSRRIDAITYLIEAEKHEGWKGVLLAYRAFLEKGGHREA